ncbi:MAG TPA: preprotein translocase subunit SecE [Candidatus Onthoplasma faecipullorum]|nr:preprotein translocase subunit SecE [Candidatus Onthoplasma faecipullorum]
MSKKKKNSQKKVNKNVAKVEESVVENNVDVLENENVVENVSETQSTETEKKDTKKEKVVEVKAKDVKKKKDKDKPKKPNKVAKAMKDTGNELKRVEWPSFKQVVKQTSVVLVFVIVFALVLFGFDRLCSWLTSLLV